jgi:hypothetical protein
MSSKWIQKSTFSMFRGITLINPATMLMRPGNIYNLEFVQRLGEAGLTIRVNYVIFLELVA